MRILLLALGFIFAFSAAAECTKEVQVTGIIGPATVDLLKRVEKRAAQEIFTLVLCGQFAIIVWMWLISNKRQRLTLAH